MAKTSIPYLHDKCRADTDGPGSIAESEGADLPATLSRLQIHDRETEEQHMRGRQYRALSLFGDAENVLWGPEDGEIVDEFQTMTSRIRTVANSISPPNLGFKTLSWKAFAEYKALSDLFDTWFGAEGKDHLQQDFPSTCPDDVLKALIGAAVTSWSFYPRPRETQSTHSLLFKTYQELILSKG